MKGMRQRNVHEKEEFVKADVEMVKIVLEINLMIQIVEVDSLNNKQILKERKKIKMANGFSGLIGQLAQLQLQPGKENAIIISLMGKSHVKETKRRKNFVQVISN